MKLASTTLAFCVTALLALGLVMLCSSSMGDRDGAHNFLMQMIWCAMGLVAGIAAVLVDYRLLRKFAWPLYILAVLLLVMVLIPHVGSTEIGAKVNGARRWIKLPFVSVRLQPSEFAKLALIIVLAWYGERYQRRMGNWREGVVIPAAFGGLMLGLIFIEPDRGTTILMAAVAGMMLLLAGLPWKFTLPPVVAGVTGLAISLLHDPMRIKRIFAWLYLEENKTGVGYQAYQARLALGSGGWTGLGLGNSREKMGFLPEHHTDFIFSIIGEELGLIATLLVVLAFVLIIISGFYIAARSGDGFGFLLGSGITLLIGLQAFINIAVVTSTLPNKGLPLPFISYGGSNLLMMLTAVGVLLGIARRARATPEARGVSLEPEGVPSPSWS